VTKVSARSYFSRTAQILLSVTKVIGVPPPSH
jgi:hypothetical protein